MTQATQGMLWEERDTATQERALLGCFETDRNCGARKITDVMVGSKIPLIGTPHHSEYIVFVFVDVSACLLHLRWNRRLTACCGRRDRQRLKGEPSQNVSKRIAIAVLGRLPAR